MDDLQKQKEHLRSVLRSCEERLRKLRVVKLHHSKGSIDELAALASKWRGVVQAAAEQLLESCNALPRPSMTDLLTALHIDPSLVQ